MDDETRGWQEQMKDRAVDLRNEAIVQGTSLYLLARRVLLAGLGAAALTADEAQAFVDKLVERGEMAEAEAQKLIQEFRQRVQEQEEHVETVAAEGSRQTESALDARIAAVLKRMNIPSKRDMDNLSQQIEMLSAKIDSLQRRKG